VHVPFPLPPPDNARAVIAQGRLLDKPQKRDVIMVIDKQVRIIGFRPNLSDARPQATAVQHCERLNTALVIPEGCQPGTCTRGTHFEA